MCKYLNPVEIPKISIENGDIKVRIYYNGIYYVAPDPLDKNNGIEDQYNQGYYISYKDYYISRSQYNDPTNWN